MTLKELEALPLGSVVSIDNEVERINVVLKTNVDEWGLAGSRHPLTSAVLFRAAVERDGSTLTVLA